VKGIVTGSTAATGGSGGTLKKGVTRGGGGGSEIAARDRSPITSGTVDLSLPRVSSHHALDRGMGAGERAPARLIR